MLRGYFEQTRVERSVTRRTDHLQINLNKNIFYGKYLTTIIDITYLYKNIFMPDFNYNH